MAMKAVGWLSQNLGWNISGRGGSSDASGGAADEARRPSGAVEGYMSHVSNVVFGGDAGNGSQRGDTATSSSNPFANVVERNNKDEVEHVELDEQGLPKTRNWYYYDEALGRWNVSPDAPQRVKDEFAERLRQEEEEKLKATRFPEPPPPPPPSFNAAARSARSPLVPQYAVPTYFDKQD